MNLEKLNALSQQFYFTEDGKDLVIKNRFSPCFIRFTPFNNKSIELAKQNLKYWLDSTLNLLPGTYPVLKKMNDDKIWLAKHDLVNIEIGLNSLKEE